MRADIACSPKRRFDEPRTTRSPSWRARARKRAEAAQQLVERYGNADPDKADVVVALGGDGLMLQTLHKFMRTGKPIYGMHRGTVGFLMNEFQADNLKERLAAARNRP